MDAVRHTVAEHFGATPGVYTALDATAFLVCGMLAAVAYSHSSTSLMLMIHHIIEINQYIAKSASRGLWSVVMGAVMLACLYGMWVSGSRVFGDEAVARVVDADMAGTLEQWARRAYGVVQWWR